LVHKLQNAYRSKDVGAVTALWSDKSPQLTAQHEELQKLLQAGPGAEVHESASKPPTISADRARIRVERETSGNKKLLVLECIKEQGEWRIWRQTPAAEELAGRLVAASSDSERAGLLSANEDLIGNDLALELIDSGRDARNQGDRQRALIIFELAYSIADRAGASQARALALNNTGLIFYDLGDFPEALRRYQSSYALSESLKDEAGMARSMNNTAAIYMDSGELSAAWAIFQKSLALGEKLHDRRLITNARANMATLYGRRGDYAQALSLLKESYDSDAKSGNKRGQTITLLNLGSVFQWQGDYAQAEDHFQRAVAVSESAGMKPLAAIALMSLGQVAQFRGELHEALAKYERSLAMFNEAGDKPYGANDLAFMGTAYSELGDLAKAIEYLQKGLDLQKTVGAGAEEALTLARMAAVYNRRREFHRALSVASEAQKLGEASGLREVLWRAHLEQGKAYGGLGQSSQAEGELAQSIATVEDMRHDVAGSESEQENFFEDKLEPYHRMLGVQAATGRNAQAFAYAEQAKARVLLDALKKGRTQLASLMTSEERQREQDLRVKMGSLNARLAHGQETLSAAERPNLAAELNRARLEYASFETTLYAAHPQWKLQSGSIEPVTLDQAVQLMAGPDSAFVEFAVTDDNLYTFVSTGRSSDRSFPAVKVFSTPVARQELAKQVERFRQQLAARDLGFRATAAALYKLLLTPATTSLANVRHLIVVPDGVLWELPFQALVKPDGQYLLDSCAISYAPSLTALRAMTEVKQQRRQSSGGFQLLAMGNPAWSRKAEERAKAFYRDQSLGNLPQAETEVRRLGRIYGEGQSHVYVGLEARESRFKSESAEPRVLHLATHGILNDSSPLYSYLLLAGDSGDSSEDGLLEAWELMRMKLNAELVVLSACETARGRVGAGEGVIGLSWALFVSGVPATVLSEWKVESDSTSRLMVAFHQNRTKGMSDADALRAAELVIRKDPRFQHPFYWAPFIIIGAAM
jgi:CHAT domain-containing protein/Tfp pilus assembly protein PilF